jgi:hypothetical protein
MQTDNSPPPPFTGRSRLQGGTIKRNYINPEAPPMGGELHKRGNELSPPFNKGRLGGIIRRYFLQKEKEPSYLLI